MCGLLRICTDHSDGAGTREGLTRAADDDRRADDQDRREHGPLLWALCGFLVPPTLIGGTAPPVCEDAEDGFLWAIADAG